MILNRVVLFFFLCCLSTIRGDAQGDLDKRLSKLTDLVEKLQQNLKEYDAKVEKLINQKEVGKKSTQTKIPTLTTAEIIYYQKFVSGEIGLEYYVQLEAINNGRLKKNIIPILAYINQVKDLERNRKTKLLYELLNDMALIMLQNRGEAEIEAYFMEIDGDIRTLYDNFDEIKSNEIQKLLKNVLPKLLRHADNYYKIEYAMSNYEKDPEYLSVLFDVWTDVIIKLPVPEVIRKMGNLDLTKIIKVYEKLLESKKGDDLVKVIDGIFSINAQNSKESIIELRQKIPYSDAELHEIIKHSTTTFGSSKLKAMMLKYYIENEPNEPKIFELGLHLGYNLPTEHLDYEYVQEVIKLLPTSIRSIIGNQTLCFKNKEGRYIYAGDYEDLLVSKENSTKPDAAEWILPTYFNKDGYYIENVAKKRYLTNTFKFGEKIILREMTVWFLTFMDSYTRVIFGDGKDYLKIRDSYLILEPTATVWDIVPNC